MRLLLLACRLSVGVLFVYAAATKLPDMAAFAVDVANYRVVPPALVPLAAAALVGVELVAGTALVVGLWARPAAILASLMLALFAAALAQALLRGIDLECGCFGVPGRATWLTVLRDAGFLVPASAVARFGGGSLRPSAPA